MLDPTNDSLDTYLPPSKYNPFFFSSRKALKYLTSPSRQAKITYISDMLDMTCLTLTLISEEPTGMS